MKRREVEVGERGQKRDFFFFFFFTLFCQTTHLAPRGMYNSLNKVNVFLSNKILQSRIYRDHQLSEVSDSPASGVSQAQANLVCFDKAVVCSRA